MQNAGARQLSSLLPSLLLLIACIAALPHWPEARLLLPDDALWNPRLLAWLHTLMFLPLAAGLAAGLLLRRPLIWPWLWLWSILSLSGGPGPGMVEQMFSLATQLCLLLLFSVAETLLVQGTLRGIPWPGRIWQPVFVAFLLLSGWLVPLVPDNMAWQRGVTIAAGLALLLHGIRWDAVPLPAVALPSIRFRIGLRLPQFRLPRAGRDRPPEVRSRPMLSLDEGYLVRHEDKPGHGRLRRTG